MTTDLRFTQIRAMARFRHADDGVATPLMLFAVLSLLMVTGLAVDYANAVRTQSRLQALADSSALAAAMRLPMIVEARDEALHLALMNGNGLGEGAMLASEDIVFGHWSEQTGNFVPGLTSPNAVQLVTRRDETAGNSLPTVLMRLVGVNRLGVEARATAVRATRLCTGTGFFSAQTTEVSNTNHFRKGFCLHGEQGVSINNSNVFAGGAAISMVNLNNFSEGTGNIGSREALLRYSHAFTVPDRVSPTIQLMRAGDLSALPAYITRGPVTWGSEIARPGTLYVADGRVNLGSNSLYRDIAIVAGGEIVFGSNVNIDRMVLASQQNIRFQSNNFIGTEDMDACWTGVYSGYMFAMGNITMNSNSTIRGVLMGARGRIQLGNNNGHIDGVTGEALGLIEFGNADRATACEEGLDSAVAGIRPAGMGGSNLAY
jgi:Flp pilus assembly protein TadG